MNDVAALYILLIGEKVAQSTKNPPDECYPLAMFAWSESENMVAIVQVEIEALRG